jgi:hypothetical protein
MGSHEKGALILAEKCSFGLQQSKEPSQANFTIIAE